MNTVGTNGSRIVYWHRELPPFDADAVAEHSIEATSSRVPGTLVHRDELWGKCYENLMACIASRLEQEVVRLGGDYAHVLDESIDSRHDGATGEAWLHGRFTYMLYRQRVKNIPEPHVTKTDKLPDACNAARFDLNHYFPQNMAQKGFCKCRNEKT